MAFDYKKARTAAAAQGDKGPIDEAARDHEESVESKPKPKRKPEDADSRKAVAKPIDQPKPAKAGGRGRPPVSQERETVATSVFLFADQQKALRHYSIDTNKSMSALIRDFVDELLKKNGYMD